MLLTFFSCSKKQNKFSETVFQDVRELTLLQKFHFKEYGIKNLHSFSSGLMLAELDKTDYNFAVVDVNLKLVKYILERNNIDIPEYYTFNNIKYSNEKVLLELNDYDRGNISSFEIDISKNFNFELKNKIKYYPEDNLGSVYVENETFVCNTTNLEPNMVYVKKYNKDFKIINTLPLKYKSDTEDLEYLWYNFNSTFVNSLTKINDDKFLISVPYIQELILINQNLEVINILETPLNNSEMTNVIDNSNKFLYLSSPIISNEEIIIAHRSHNGDFKKHSTSLLFYDFELNPKFKINLNHSISNLSLSHNQDKLYAIDFEEETVYIYDNNSLK